MSIGYYWREGDKRPYLETKLMYCNSFSLRQIRPNTLCVFGEGPWSMARLALFTRAPADGTRQLLDEPAVPRTGAYSNTNHCYSAVAARPTAPSAALLRRSDALIISGILPSTTSLQCATVAEAVLPSPAGAAALASLRAYYRDRSSQPLEGSTIDTRIPMGVMVLPPAVATPLLPEGMSASPTVTSAVVWWIAIPAVVLRDVEQTADRNSRPPVWMHHGDVTTSLSAAFLPALRGALATALEYVEKSTSNDAAWTLCRTILTAVEDVPASVSIHHPLLTSSDPTTDTYVSRVVPVALVGGSACPIAPTMACPSPFISSLLTTTRDLQDASFLADALTSSGARPTALLRQRFATPRASAATTLRQLSSIPAAFPAPPDDLYGLLSVNRMLSIPPAHTFGATSSQIAFNVPCGLRIPPQTPYCVEGERKVSFACAAHASLSSSPSADDTSETLSGRLSRWALAPPLRQLVDGVPVKSEGPGTFVCYAVDEAAEPASFSRFPFEDISARVSHHFPATSPFSSRRTSTRLCSMTPDSAIPPPCPLSGPRLFDPHTEHERLVLGGKQWGATIGVSSTPFGASSTPSLLMLHKGYLLERYGALSVWDGATCRASELLGSRHYSPVSNHFQSVVTSIASQFSDASLIATVRRMHSLCLFGGRFKVKPAYHPVICEVFIGNRRTDRLPVHESADIFAFFRFVLNDPNLQSAEFGEVFRHIHLILSGTSDVQCFNAHAAIFREVSREYHNVQQIHAPPIGFIKEGVEPASVRVPSTTASGVMAMPKTIYVPKTDRK